MCAASPAVDMITTPLSRRKPKIRAPIPLSVLRPKSCCHRTYSSMNWHSMRRSSSSEEKMSWLAQAAHSIMLHKCSSATDTLTTLAESHHQSTPPDLHGTGALCSQDPADVLASRQLLILRPPKSSRYESGARRSLRHSSPPWQHQLTPRRRS